MHDLGICKVCLGGSRMSDVGIKLLCQVSQDTSADCKDGGFGTAVVMRLEVWLFTAVGSITVALILIAAD